MNKVELEFKRIQTYLFASPRLRAMLGANASLGRTIRIELPRIARDCEAWADPQITAKMPGAATEDPLAQVPMAAAAGLSEFFDDPAGIYRTYGVLVRDGGHFIATFPDSDKARHFIECANECITKALPGILLEARLDGHKIQHANILGESLFQHPGFQVSQHLGNQPAESRGAKAAFVSAEEKMMEAQGKSFREQPADMIALLEKNRLIPCPEEPPQSVADLADGDYLALIHADGNSIGQRYQGWRDKVGRDKANSLEMEAHGEHFFHSMRVTVRRALTGALNQVFENAPTRYQLLMLGGDDLLLACAARYALPFVRAYAEALDRLPLCDGKPLSIGAGVIIAKETFPFHRLHAMAEALADSAKQRYRAEPSLGSVVDWHVTSSSWVEDPIAERRADSLAAHAVLSDKPYPVLGPCSLDALLKEAGRIGQSPNVARSQLRNLVETMRQGTQLAELAWHELPDAMRPLLASALAAFGQNGLFRPVCDTLQTSVLPDLVELIEIERQQCQNPEEAAA